MLEKIAKLLNQSERAATEAEANAFLTKAQELATLNSVDLAKARQHTQKNERREDPTQEYVSFESINRNNRSHAVYLYAAIADNNDVKLTIRPRSIGINVFGFPSDIEVVNAMFIHLMTQMVEAGNAFIRSGAHKTETRTVFNENTYEYETKPVDGRIARTSFNRAFIRAVNSRLALARLEVIEAAEKQTTGTELVLLEKSREVEDFYNRKANARGTYRGGKSSGSSHTANRAGDAAGQRARMGGQTAMSGARTAINA